ncbi:zinc ABC transporter substrate-binding protein [Microbacterium sp. LRZ72]|uniref:metal ABC transporter solute-binding protein, Zn/Mn family n=1 Tax=Microbacterium sp. LRZ72 TaxID=2942481 RepID=UPI0029B464F8|nr:zinc ABC transporter substrate-binding protein [Microbacterium sp. LRZ72]MDX2376140.1 zinc ABC transporter substrate-binding protein [Microbacterium sp. LRZ72]
MNSRRLPAALILPAVSALALAGCAGTSEPGDESDTLTVVASTNVYGQIAQEIGGEDAEVVSIIDSGAQDPHEYEATAQDQLTIAEADLIIENGGGYDAFVDGLIESSGTDVPVLTAAEYAHDWPGDEHSEEEHSDDEHAEDEHAEEEHAEDEHAGHDHIEGFNEHVWYDPHTMEHLAEDIAAQLSTMLPERAEVFEDNAQAFIDGIAELEVDLAELEAEQGGAEVFVTEPVPVYLIASAGLTDVTPAAFSEAVEEGQDVPPATLLEALEQLDSGDVRVVITNAQTGGAETTQVIDAADAAGIPVIEFSETLPEGQTYLSWMTENISALSGALAE